MDHSPRARDERWQGEGGVGDFAAKVPVAIFGAAAGTASQALLCQNLAAVPAMAFLGMPTWVAHVFWFLGVLIAVICFVLYSLKVFFHFPLVYHEIHHPFHSNLFFVAILSGTFLLMSTPEYLKIDAGLVVVWGILGVISMGLIWVKMLGWFGGEGEGIWRRNPAYFFVTINPILLASLDPQLVPSLGSLSSVICSFLLSVGVVLYTYLFVSFPYKLPSPPLSNSNSFSLPPSAEPLYFLFQAPPFATSVSLNNLRGQFGDTSIFLWGMGLFLGVMAFLKGLMFARLEYSLCWWACVFPCASGALSTMLYANQQDLLLASTNGEPDNSLKYLALTFSLMSFLFFLINCLGCLSLLFQGQLFLRSDPVDEQEEG